MKKVLSIIIMFALAMTFAALAYAQGDPFLGTWKLNVNKSKFTPGLRKSETRIVVTGPNGMDVSIKRVNGNGATQEFEYTTNLDGKRHPITGDRPEGPDSIAVNLAFPAGSRDGLGCELLSPRRAYRSVCLSIRISTPPVQARHDDVVLPPGGIFL